MRAAAGRARGVIALTALVAAALVVGCGVDTAGTRIPGPPTSSSAEQASPSTAPATATGPFGKPAAPSTPSGTPTAPAGFQPEAVTAVSESQ
jgi:hypothetical protein